MQDHCDHVDGTSCAPQDGPFCTTPIKSKENQGKRRERRPFAAVVQRQDGSLLTTWFCCVAGLLPESPSKFFNSSPFKVLSPQPAKFLKSLLPVREENRARKALEARPLLAQEVRSKTFSLILSQWPNEPLSSVSFTKWPLPSHLSTFLMIFLWTRSSFPLKLLEEFLFKVLWQGKRQTNRDTTNVLPCVYVHYQNKIAWLQLDTHTSPPWWKLPVLLSHCHVLILSCWVLLFQNISLILHLFLFFGAWSRLRLEAVERLVPWTHLLQSCFFIVPGHESVTGSKENTGVKYGWHLKKTEYASFSRFEQIQLSPVMTKVSLFTVICLGLAIKKMKLWTVLDVDLRPPVFKYQSVWCLLETTEEDS